MERGSRLQVIDSPSPFMGRGPGGGVPSEGQALRRPGGGSREQDKPFAVCVEGSRDGLPRAKNMDTLNIGIIGAGGIVKTRHLPGLRKIPGVEVVAVCNRTRESGEA